MPQRGGLTENSFRQREKGPFNWSSGLARLHLKATYASSLNSSTEGLFSSSVLLRRGAKSAPQKSCDVVPRSLSPKLNACAASVLPVRRVRKRPREQRAFYSTQMNS